jgi:hypothetical protein
LQGCDILTLVDLALGKIGQQLLHKQKIDH